MYVLASFKSAMMSMIIMYVCVKASNYVTYKLCSCMFMYVCLYV